MRRVARHFAIVRSRADESKDHLDDQLSVVLDVPARAEIATEHMPERMAVGDRVDACPVRPAACNLLDRGGKDLGAAIVARRNRS